MVVSAGKAVDRDTNSRAKALRGDAREAWPRLPRLSLAGRWHGRRGYPLLDRLERGRFRRRLPFRLGRSYALVRREQRLLVLQLDPAVTGRSAARTNLDLVVDLCERNKIEYFLVTEPNLLTAHVAVVDWDAFVTALAHLGAVEPVYACVGAKTRSTYSRWSELTFDPTLVEAMRNQDDIEIFRPVAARKAGPDRGRTWACRVERWRSDPGGRLIASEPNSRSQAVARSLAGTTTVDFAGRPVATLEVFTGRQLFEVDFPIDVVYLWVDGDDPDWRARKAAALGETVGEADAVADARFRDGGELMYSMRSLAQFAPWVRRVFLVTDRQVPTWLNLDEPRLTVVDHRELFGDAGTLPTFNSHAIGARLHHIDGLAEHYLYFNDDVFVGSDVTPVTFFEANGMSKFFLSKSSLAFTDDTERLSHESARRNVANLLERDFGSTATNLFYHSPIPQRRSTMAELEARYPDEFATTWHNQFRSHSDIESNSWLHHYYGYLTGKAVPAKISYTYVQLGGPTAEVQLKRLARARDRDVFCINDHVDASPEQHAFAAEWLAEYFPVPSPFEKEG